MVFDIKSPKEIELMRAVGRLSAETLLFVGDKIRAGMTTQQIDDLVHEHTLSQGGAPGRRAPELQRGSRRVLCTSVNDVVCHGIPNG